MSDCVLSKHWQNQTDILDVHIQPKKIQMAFICGYMLTNERQLEKKLLYSNITDKMLYETSVSQLFTVHLFSLQPIIMLFTYGLS